MFIIDIVWIELLLSLLTLLFNIWQRDKKWKKSRFDEHMNTDGRELDSRKRKYIIIEAHLLHSWLFITIF